jgi:hypothetical protein
MQNGGAAIVIDSTAATTSTAVKGSSWSTIYSQIS